MTPAPRFRLLPALWTAGQRLRQRGSPILALTIGLVGLPNAMVAAANAGQRLDWGGLAVGALIGLVLSGLCNGAIAWLSLSGGEDPWGVAAEGLGRALFKLSPLAGFVLLLNLPDLAVTVLALLIQMGVVPPLGVPLWTGLSWLAWVTPALAMALVAPVIGILMFEGGDLIAALRQAWRMTRGSRIKLGLLELAQIALLVAIGFGAGRLPVSLGVAAIAGATAIVNAVATTVVSVVLHQAYLQLHALGSQPAEQG